MKKTARISIAIALGLASFATLSGLQAAPLQQADKTTEAKDKTAAAKSNDGKDKNTEQKRAEATAEQRQMRDLDEQVQQTKSDVLAISAELNQLEEKLIYPSGTQVAVFVALAKGDQMRLDAVRLQIDGQLVAHYIYSAKELEALRKGGVQRIYVGNVTTGDHQLNVLVDGKLKSGADFNRTEHFTFHKQVKPGLVELTVAGESGSPITFEEL